MHYFHTYAVQDRIDLSRYGNNPCLPDVLLVKSQLCKVLTTDEDVKILCRNFVQLVARVLKKYMLFFSSLGASLKRHIVHKFHKEMSQKSEVVSSGYNYLCLKYVHIYCQIPLGILLKSETSYETMLHIMEDLYQYSPICTKCGDRGYIS